MIAAILDPGPDIIIVAVVLILAVIGIGLLIGFAEQPDARKRRRG